MNAVMNDGSVVVTSSSISKEEIERAELIASTMGWWDKFNKKFGRAYAYPTIIFELKGSMAGWAKYISQVINYNMDIYSNNKEAFIKRTVPHEIAHLFSYKMHVENGRRDKLMPHGKEWKYIMMVMGVESTRCHNYDVKFIRKAKREYVYKCDCREHKVTNIIHSRVSKNLKGYKCKRCGGIIKFAYKSMSSEDIENNKKRIEEEKKRLEEQLAMLG